MLLTGFDAPIEQVMYIDKKIKDHNLLQTIARVNRVAKNKSRGYIVDYIGLANHLKDALSIYGADDQKDIQDSLKDITVELPVLENRYQRLLNLFRENGVGDIQDFVEQTNADANKSHQILEASIEIMEDIKLRATFEVYFKNFMQSLDIILPKSSAIPYKIPVKRFGYILIKIKERYKDETLNISGSGEKVKKLINDHLISLGINPKIPPVELLSDRFIAEVEKNKSHKAKASEMAHDAFKAFYKEKGKNKITKRINLYKGRLGVNPNSVRIIELKNRWASCSHKGNLNFHWKVMMTPMKILDYIVVHELAHLLHANHTIAFWNEIDKLLPDYKERKLWLKVNGAGMDI